MKRPNTTTVLLAVVAVLLALNLIATTSPAADNDANASPPAPYIVKLLPRSSLEYVRVWSDGRADTINRSDGTCDYEVSSAFGPVEHPFPVVDAALGSNHDVPDVMMTFGDGRVDLIGGGPPRRCTIAGIGTPSLCIGDVDRNGTVGIEDFLLVLAEWGCQ